MFSLVFDPAATAIAPATIYVVTINEINKLLAVHELSTYSGSKCGCIPS